MSLLVTYTFTCEARACEAKATQQWALSYGAVSPPPALPPSWYTVAGLLLCGRHTVRIEVDGHALVVEELASELAGIIPTVFTTG